MNGRVGHINIGTYIGTTKNVSLKRFYTNILHNHVQRTV